MITVYNSKMLQYYTQLKKNKLKVRFFSYCILTMTSSCCGFPQPLTERQMVNFRQAGYQPIGPGTDIGMHNTGLFEGDIIIQRDNLGMISKAVTEEDKRWPDGVVVYKVDDDVGCPESPQCEILMKAMDHYHHKSCIRFKEWSGEKNYIHVFFNKNNSGACYSSVGLTGDGEQLMSLGQRCWYFGIVLHELGHTIGFWHEMNRPDRDDWIVVYWKNIIKGFRPAFKKNDPNRVPTFGEKFDYNSIMMYDEYAFSKDGKAPTLQAKTGQIIGPIWKKRGLSKSDISRLHKLYNCEGNTQKPAFPYNVDCSFNNNTCGFKNGGSAVWNWRKINESDGYMYATWEIAGATPGYLTSVNFHPISAKDKARSPFGCVKFWYLIQGDGPSSLKLSQIFLTKTTQLIFDLNEMTDLWHNETAINNKWIHVDVPLYVTRPFKLVFESQFQEDSKFGTVALDDFELVYKECDESSQTDFNYSKPNIPDTVPTESAATTEEPDDETNSFDYDVLPTSKPEDSTSPNHE